MRISGRVIDKIEIGRPAIAKRAREGWRERINALTLRECTDIWQGKELKKRRTHTFNPTTISFLSVSTEMSDN